MVAFNWHVGVNSFISTIIYQQSLHFFKFSILLFLLESKFILLISAVFTVTLLIANYCCCESLVIDCRNL